MVIRVLTSLPQGRSTCSRLFRIPAFVALLGLSCGSAALQQSPTAPAEKRSSAEVASPFQEAESLLAQGLLDQAREKIQEQLKQNPRSVEGYNLLGIVCSTQKDYRHALESFQQALRINFRSTKTHNNLANLYVIQGKSDLAEKE